MLTCFLTDKPTALYMSCKEERLQHINALSLGASTITHCIMATILNCNSKFHIAGPAIVLTGVVQIATVVLQMIWAHLIQIPINTTQRTTYMKLLKIASGLTKYVKEEHSNNG